MSQVVSGTRKDAVLRQLRGEIVSNQLLPRTILKDAEIAARLGVSITPVREAIAQLAAEGLIDIAPNRTRRVTHVTQKSALELIDVITVLCCAGFEWGLRNLTDTHLATLQRQFEEFEASLHVGDLTTATIVGSGLSSTVIKASGNHELQTHIDLISTRSLRVLALTEEGQAWDIWRTGYRDLMRLVQAGENTAALERYRQIFVDYRAGVEAMLFG